MLGYEFPEMKRGHDANRLMVRVRVEPVDGEEWSIEPNLSFEVIGRTGGLTTIPVYFELELRPS